SRGGGDRFPARCRLALCSNDEDPRDQRQRRIAMSTIGAVAGIAALVVSILAYLRTGRSRPFAFRLSARPLGAAAVLVAAAATAGALYASEASEATGSKPVAEPV